MSNTQASAWRPIKGRSAVSVIVSGDGGILPHPQRLKGPMSHLLLLVFAPLGLGLVPGFLPELLQRLEGAECAQKAIRV